MRAIKIDVLEQSVYQVELEEGDGHLQSIYKHLDCEIFTPAIQYPTGDYVYVDDEGLLVPYEKIKGCFLIHGGAQPLMGHGLVVGVDEEGESCDVKLTVPEVFAMVKFIPKEHVKTFIKSFQ